MAHCLRDTPISDITAYVSESLRCSVFARADILFGGFTGEESCIMWIEAVFPHHLPDQFEGQELIEWSQQILGDRPITINDSVYGLLVDGLFPGSDDMLLLETSLVRKGGLDAMD